MKIIIDNPAKTIPFVLFHDVNNLNVGRCSRGCWPIVVEFFVFLICIERTNVTGWRCSVVPTKRKRKESKLKRMTNGEERRRTPTEKVLFIFNIHLKSWWTFKFVYKCYYGHFISLSLWSDRNNVVPQWSFYVPPPHYAHLIRIFPYVEL